MDDGCRHRSFLAATVTITGRTVGATLGSCQEGKKKKKEKNYLRFGLRYHGYMSAHTIC
jgi:hypothetical protein